MGILKDKLWNIYHDINPIDSFLSSIADLRAVGQRRFCRADKSGGHGFINIAFGFPSSDEPYIECEIPVDFEMAFRKALIAFAEDQKTAMTDNLRQTLLRAAMKI